ncbi:hypothetical protein KEM54_004863 [Ascosphaera aggregata]|nr:hypothetical protein KEM54_004863 [Ascosphaera aggregata]
MSLRGASSLFSPRSSGPYACACSYNGQYVGVLENGGAHLSIYEIEAASTANLLRSIELHTRHHGRKGSGRTTRMRSVKDAATPVVRNQGSILRWSRPEAEATDSSRVLICTENHISVYDIRDSSWSAEITLGELSNIPYIDFGSTHNSIFVFSEFNIGLHVLLLTPLQQTNDERSNQSGGQHLLIKSPKPPPYSFCIRPRTSHLALLTKQETTDILTVFNPLTHEPIRSTVLPTVDAQVLKWSPDGFWLVVCDVAGLGTRIVICTAEGEIHKTYTGGDDLDKPEEDQLFQRDEGGYSGVKKLTWSNDSRFLILGMADGSIEVLDGMRFKLVDLLNNPIQFGSSGRKMYVEQANPTTGISIYVPVPEQSTFPYAFDKDRGPGRSISHLEVNSNGTMIASVDSGIPNILWIWATKSSRSSRSDLIGALIQKSPIKKVIWHPASSQSDLLLTMNDETALATIHQWRVLSEGEPRIARVADITAQPGTTSDEWSTMNKQYARWYSSKESTNSQGLIWYCTKNNWILGYAAGEGEECMLRPVLGVTDKDVFSHTN